MGSFGQNEGALGHGLHHQGKQVGPTVLCPRKEEMMGVSGSHGDGWRALLEQGGEQRCVRGG